MSDKWKCHFKELPEKITVGDILYLFCDGTKPLPLKKENLFIRFPSPEDRYKLHILKTAYLDSDSAELAVTSYRPGDFQESFFVTDGEREFFVEDLTFSVQSVLPQNPIAPHPPFGPWKISFPPFYIALWGLILFLYLLVSFLTARFFILRKKFLKEVESRKVSHPLKVFARTVRRFDEKHKNFMSNLETALKLFLENRFFIPSQQRRPSQIVQSLKKYHPDLYKKYGSRLLGILKEFEWFQGKEREEASLQLKKSCFELVFEMGGRDG